MVLPEEIKKAIEALCDAEHAQVIEGSHRASAWCEAAKVCQKAREALTAAILSRLGEAEAERDEVRDQLGNALRRWVDTEIKISAALARVERLEKALEASTYLASRYRACWLRTPVRDLAEAEAWVESTRAALSEPPPQGEQ